MLALDYPPVGGGISRLLEAWTVDTDVMEWQVITSTPGPDTSRVSRVRSRRPRARSALRQARWCGDGDPGLVVAGHPYLSGVAVAVAAGVGARSGCIVYGKEIVPMGLKHRLALKPLAQISVVVAISDNSARLAVEAGAKKDHVAVVRPRIGPPWTALDAPRRDPNDGLHLVTLSRLSEGYKNLELLLRLTALLRPIGVVQRLTIIGGGPRLHALQSKARWLGISDVVDFPGQISDGEVAEILRECHLGLFPSRDSIAENGFEGFGLVVHELAAGGLPVLVGNAAGATDAAGPGWSWLLDPDDLWAWVDAVERLYANEHARLTMGKAALTWASQTDLTGSARELAEALLAGIRPRGTPAGL